MHATPTPAPEGETPERGPEQDGETPAPDGPGDADGVAQRRWLHLIEGWWRLFRRKALAGQSFADQHDIAYASRIATAQLNRHACPWIWGRPPPPHRRLRRCLVYRL